MLAAPACPWWLLPWGSLEMKLTAFSSGDWVVAFRVCLFAEVQSFSQPGGGRGVPAVLMPAANRASKSERSSATGENQFR